MEPGYAEVAVPKWFFVYNHLHTVHAITSCNAAEAAMGMAMEATVPTSHRWDSQSHERAVPGEGHHVAAGARPGRRPRFRDPDESTDVVVVSVSVVDTSGEEVVHADITTWVTPA